MSTAPSTDVPAQPAAAWIGALVGLVGAVAISLQWWLKGSWFISNDESIRTLNAWAWAHEPTLTHYGAWLPLLDPIIGLPMALTGELLITPRVVALVAVVLTSAIVAHTAARLAGDGSSAQRAAAATAALAFVSMPLVWWVGSVPLAEPFFMLAVAVATDQLVEARGGRLRPLLSAGGALFVANGLRFEGWYRTFVVGCALIVRATSAWRQADRTGAAAALGALAIACVMPAFWLVGSWVATGNALATAAFVTSQLDEAAAGSASAGGRVMTLLAELRWWLLAWLLAGGVAAWSFRADRVVRGLVAAWSATLVVVLGTAALGSFTTHLPARMLAVLLPSLAVLVGLIAAVPRRATTQAAIVAAFATGAAIHLALAWQSRPVEPAADDIELAAWIREQIDRRGLFVAIEAEPHGADAQLRVLVQRPDKMPRIGAHGLPAPLSIDLVAAMARPEIRGLCVWSDALERRIEGRPDVFVGAGNPRWRVFGVRRPSP